MFKNETRSRAKVVTHDYYVSTWDKLINKTQTTNQDLKRGSYSRSKQRDKDEGSSKRTMDPNYYDVGVNQLSQVQKQPQTVKNSTSKSVSFKPPLAPRDSITG